MIASNSQPPSNIGNTLFVDAVYGSASGDGAVSAPFLTLGAAQSAAVSGQFIWVRPGSYTVTAPILKNGVNWWFDAGASVSFAVPDAAASFTGILSDNGSAITCSVFGNGDFSTTGANASICCAGTTNASSNITIDARTITCSCSVGGLSFFSYGIYANGGVLDIRASVSINGIINNTSNIGAQGAGVWWGKSNGYVSAPSITGTTNAIAMGVGGTTAWNFYVECDEAVTNGTTELFGQAAIISYLSSNPNCALWIRCSTVISSIGGDYTAIYNTSSTSSKVYVQCQKIFGEVICAGGLLYVDSDKIESLSNVTGSATALFVECPGGTLRYNVRQHDPKAFTGIGFLIDGGTFISNGIEYTGGSGSDGFSISGGTARLQTAILNTAANSSGFPITKTGGTLILNGCTMVAEGSNDSIHATTAQTVLCNASWANTAANVSNVTVTPTAGLVVNSSVQ